MGMLNMRLPPRRTAGATGVTAMSLSVSHSRTVSSSRAASCVQQPAFAIVQDHMAAEAGAPAKLRLAAPPTMVACRRKCRSGCPLRSKRLSLSMLLTSRYREQRSLN